MKTIQQSFKNFYELEALFIQGGTTCPKFWRYDKGKYKAMNKAEKENHQREIWNNEKELVFFETQRDNNGKYTAIYCLDTRQLSESKQKQIDKIIEIYVKKYINK